MSKKKTLNTPQQDRSRRTLERLEAAARELLEEKGFDHTSVVAIARRANSSVGAFYARFADKDALLDHMLEVALGEFLEAGKQWRRREHGVGEPRLADTVGAGVVSLVGFHRKYRGVLRALVLRSRGAKRDRFRRTMASMYETLPEFVELVLGHRSEITHASPEIGAHVGLTMVLGALRERILFGEGLSSAPPLSDDLLAEELTQAYLAYLGGELS